MLSNLTARKSGALHPKPEITIDDIAVVVDSVIRNTIHGHIGIWHAAAKINRDTVREHIGLEGWRQHK